MRKKHMKIICFVAASILIMEIVAIVLLPKPHDTTIQGNNIGIARTVGPAEPNVHSIENIPPYDSQNDNPFQINLQGADMRAMHLSGQHQSVTYSVFDTNTLWPDNLPSGFNPTSIIENGKNPGLGINALHQRGIDGRGVSIAIIDQTLFTDHEQYNDRLKHYEEFNLFEDDVAPQMHGAAVASLSVGKDIGVAPGADLYYFAVWHSNVFDQYDLSYYAKAIDHILEINTTLPPERKIRVVSISNGWNKNQKGLNNMLDAIERAKAENVFVITTAINNYYKNITFAGLDRDPNGDPDDATSYSVGNFQKQYIADRASYYENALFLPMDSRTYASVTGSDAYEYARIGGLSWSAPYAAGLYALAVQVQSDITPEEFWQAALDTADSVSVENNGESYIIQHMVNPTRLLDFLNS